MSPQPQPIVWPGRPYPLGSMWDGEGVNFALYSEHAEKVELCLFDITGKREILRVPLPEQTDMVWQATCRGASRPVVRVPSVWPTS